MGWEAFVEAFEGSTGAIMSILSLSIGGISIGSITAMAVYLARTLSKYKQEASMTKMSVEEAFKSAVLPKSIKLDVSKKIDEPIRAGLAAISNELGERLAKLEKGERLMMSVLSQFTHLQKLPKEVQDEIKEFLDDDVTENVNL